MKIVSVTFLNLNSLKGKQEIHFDRTPFNLSGLFAITGPTGAGKTTILDAITVALYGKVHRHEKDVEHCMTRFTAESYSEVEFEVNGKRYKSKWSQRRSKGRHDGNLQTARMELSECSTNIIIVSHPLAEVQRKIIELVGLDYSQFLRSVMLCQGDFTRFLKASENERSELLEKITDTAIYSEISSFIYQKSKDEKLRLDTLKGQMGDIELLSSEYKEKMTGQIENCKEVQSRVNSEKATTEQSLAWLQKIATLEEKRTETTEQLNHILQEKADQKEVYEKINIHNRAIVYQPALLEIAGLQGRVQEITDNIENASDSRQELEGQKQEKSNEFAISKEAYAKAEQDLLEATPVFENIIRKDAEIDVLFAQLNRSKETLEDIQGDFDVAEFAIRENKKNLDECVNELNQMRRWVEEHTDDRALEADIPLFKANKEDLLTAKSLLNTIDDSITTSTEILTNTKQLVEDENESIQDIDGEIYDLEDEKNSTSSLLATALGNDSLTNLENTRESLPQLLRQLNEQRRVSNDWHQFKAKKEAIENQIQQLQAQYDEELECLNGLHLEKSESTTHLMNLQALVELEMRIQKYEADRLLLEQNKPCPLCGSLEHPFIENGYQNRLTESQKKRDDHKKLIESIEQKIREKTAAESALSTSLAKSKRDIDDLAAQIDSLESTFGGNNLILGTVLKIDDTKEIDTLIDEKERRHEELRQTVENIRRHQEKLSELDGKIQQKQTTRLGKEGTIRQYQERITNTEKEIERLQKEKSAQQTVISTTTSTLTEFFAKYTIPYQIENLDVIERQLNERQTYYTRNVGLLHGLEVKNTHLQTSYDAGFIAQSERHTRLEDQRTIVSDEQSKLSEKKEERSSLFGDKDPVQERTRLQKATDLAKKAFELVNEELISLSQKIAANEHQISEWQKEVDEKRPLLEMRQNRLEEQIYGAGFESIESVKSSILQTEQANNFEQLKHRIEQNIHSTKVLLADIEKDLAAEKSKQLTEEPVGNLLLTLQQQKEELDRVQKSILELELGLDQNEKKEEKFAALAEQLVTQQKNYFRWEKLSSMIGSADGKKFSRFAQGLTLERLTQLANQHLKKLTDRYTILKTPGEDLELQILDAYQADVARPMTTLSGGESFLVSLALALGLSELAGHKTQIDSLFIDEGFGTLDADTLDIAITALENLQASGKMIGIISHVDALKERIGVQIEVQKQQGGHSRLSIKNYNVAYA